MSKLEDLQPNAALRSILSDYLVKAVKIQWFGSEVLDLNCKTSEGNPANELLYHHNETGIKVVKQGRTWSFNENVSAFRLFSKTHLICLAYIFDFILAVHTSVFDLLLHQIIAVYNMILYRQLPNYRMEDSLEAGMLILGLLISELMIGSFFNVARVV